MGSVLQQGLCHFVQQWLHHALLQTPRDSGSHPKAWLWGRGSFSLFLSP